MHETDKSTSSDDVAPVYTPGEGIMYRALDFIQKFRFLFSGGPAEPYGYDERDDDF